MKKMVIIACCITLALGGVLFAGGQKESPTSAPAVAKEVKMRFSWWGGDDRHKATLAALELYSKKYPNVKIEGEYGAFGSFYQKLLTQLNGGTAPDVFQVDFKWVNDLLSQNKNWFVNMNGLADRIDMSGIDMKFARDWAAVGDFLIGLPMGVNGIGLTYNKELVNKAGIEMNDSWDWDSLLAAGAKVKQFDKTKFAVLFNRDYFTYMLKVQMKQRTGNDLVKPDFSLGFERADLVDTFAYIRKLLDTGTIPPLEETVPFEKVYADQTPKWLNQNYAIYPTSSSLLPRIKAASKFELGVARYPVLKNAKNPGLITAPTMMISLNASSPNRDEAIKFVNWIMNDKEAVLALVDSRGLPAVKQARDMLLAAKLMDPIITRMVESALPFSGGPEGALSQSQEVVVLVEDYIQKVGYGKLAPEQAADGFMKDLADKAAEMKKKK
jgi:oligogalacturonide transport system substrate-binding protein